MSYIKLIGIDELENNEMRKVDIGESTVLVIKFDNNFYALSNKCPHMGGSLGDGTLENGVVRCPRHGSGFDVKTGKCVINPRILFVEMKTGDATTYKVKIEDNVVYAEIK